VAGLAPNSRASASTGNAISTEASQRFARRPKASTLGMPSNDPAAMPRLNSATNSAVTASIESGAARIIQF